MLRALLLALLWRGSLAQVLFFSLTVPQSVPVQEGLCVLIPCTFTYPARHDTDNPQAQLHGHWFKGSADIYTDPPVASSDPSRGVSQETRGRFRLVGDPVRGNCSLQIDDARRTDTGQYFLRVERGKFKYTYRVSTGYTEPSISVLNPPGPPNITWTLTRNKHPVLGPVMWGAEGDGLSLETQERDSLTLICEAGSKPMATLSWTKANESLSPGPGWVGCLELSNLSRGDAGEYRCWAKNPYGSASRALRVHVQAPEMTLQTTVSRADRSDPQLFPDLSTPVANGSWLTAREGDSLRFLCSVTSRSPATLAWVWGGRAIKDTPSVRENRLQLELRNVTAEDGGLYGCQAWSQDSSAQGTFQLVVESPRGGRTRAFIEISCKLVFVATGFLLAYYLTLLYYRRTPCCCPGRRRKDRPETLMATACLPASPTPGWEVD